MPSALRTAMERRDLDAVAAAFAEEAVLRSPVTDRLLFRGPAEIAALCGVVLESFTEFRYTDEMMGEGGGFLTGEARVEGIPIEFADHMRFGADGLIVELTVYFRPLPAAAVAMRVIGAGLVRRRSAARGAVVSNLAWPLGVAVGVGDRLGTWLVRR